MANDFEGRLGKLEGDFNGIREYIPILSGYIDELRVWTQELRQDHKDSLKRIEQNEQMMGHLVETQGMMLQIIDRMDQKLDNLGKPGTNGHT